MRNSECGIQELHAFLPPHSAFAIPHYCYIFSGAFTPRMRSALWITVFTCFIRKSLAPVLARSSVITRCLK